VTETRKLAARRRILRTIGLVIVMTLGLSAAAFFAFPFAWMVLSSLKEPREFLTVPVTWMPKRIRWENYVNAIMDLPMARAYLISVIHASFQMLVTIITSALAGYALAKYKFRGKDLIFKFILATMMIPFFVQLIPLYFVVYHLGWINTLWAILIPGSISSYGIFMMRQFVLGIHNDLLDAARVDGCSELGIFWMIVLPLLKPAALTLGVLTFMGTWNSFFWPMIVINDQKLWTVQLLLRSLQTEYGDPRDWGILMAGLVIATIPTLVLFLAIQKYIVRGIAFTGIKR